MGRTTNTVGANLPRGRLLEKLAATGGFVHLRAPTGFGKTILLDQFEARQKLAGERVFRLNLPRGAGGGISLEQLAKIADLAPGADFRALVRTFETFEDTTLVIDNADRLAGSPDIRELLVALTADPSKLRIVLASRGEVDLPLARLEVAGNLLRIGPHAMLFDKEEQLALLETLDGEPFASPHRDLIFGWPLAFGLQARIATEVLQSKEFAPDDFADRTIKGTWRLLRDYFDQEIMEDLPGDVSAFLVRASILDSMRVEDCRELWGGNCAGYLEKAYRSGVPLWPVDPEHRAYQMLPVFRQFLRAQLDEKEAKELGSKACKLLERREDFSGASVMALEIGDHPLAAQLVELQMRSDFGLRDETRLLALAERIEPTVRNQHPRILLAESQFLIFKFEFEQARRLLERARDLIEERSAQENCDAGEIRSLEMLVLHREMVLALGQHDLSLAQDYGGKLLAGMEDVPPAQRVMLLASLIYAQQELYIFRGAERYYAQAKKLVPALDSWIWSVPLETFYARHLFQTGRTTAAIDLLEATLARLTNELGPRPVFGSILAVALAEIKFETGSIDEAEELLRHYGDNIEQFGYLSLIVAARVTKARVHMARGEYDAGFAVLERPAISAGELFDKLTRSLSIERNYWLLRLAREDAPRLAHADAGLSVSNPPDPHGSSGTSEEACAVTWIQLARAGRRFGEAIQLAQKWQRHTEGLGAVRSNVRWLVMLASLRSLSEEPRLAMRQLRRAVKLGVGGEYRAAFLPEVDVLHEHLAILADSDLEEAEMSFVRSIIGAPRKPATTDVAIDLPLPLGAFSSREIAVLRLVAKGHTNKEIGITLGMTEGTVKWYLHKIYDMLGLRRRSQVATLISQWHMRAIERGEETPFGDDD